MVKMSGERFFYTDGVPKRCFHKPFLPKLQLQRCGIIFYAMNMVFYLFIIKLTNMHYNQSCAAKGNHYGNSSARNLFNRSMQRAAVNIYKTETSFEMLVFAPGRIKEHFSLQVNGRELTVSYTPPEGFPRPEWVRREYSRGGFSRSFNLDGSIDIQKITAAYTDGVLQVSLPLAEGAVTKQKDIVIN